MVSRRLTKDPIRVFEINNCPTVVLIVAGRDVTDQTSTVNIGLKPGQYVGVKRHQLRSDMTRAPIGALVISCGGC